MQPRTTLTLTLGVLLGFLLASLLPSRSLPSLSSTTRIPTWRSAHIPSSHRTGSAKQPVALPNPDARLRVLELLSTLSPRYTKECTMHSQPLYIKQVLDRYAPLIGHTSPIDTSWLSSLLGHTSPNPKNPQTPLTLTPSTHKYFIAINLYNSFSIIPDLFATLFRIASILGFPNVFISIYENGSTDQTKALLRLFTSLTLSSGLRITIRTSTRTRGAFNHRIEYLAEVRNSAFVPLHELRDANGEYFDSIVFMNDILPCIDDILELIFQSRMNNAGITCAADYMYHNDLQAPVFYDNWVARDINGTALENAPFERVFRHDASKNRWIKHLPVQVQSCWNGVAVLDPAPFYSPPHVRFRMARITDGECSASECSLVCNDYWEAGYGRIMMVPRVKLAYDAKVYDIIHPPRRNLTAIRGYKRLGGVPEFGEEVEDGSTPRTDPQDRTWFGPHDRLFVPDESRPLEFGRGPESVWCWGWDGAGDLEGPDVDPIWETMPNRSRSEDAVRVRHDRGLGVY